MKKPPLRSIRVKNFKSIRDSGRVEFGPLTALIGNNGTGKSSLVEALETYRDVLLFGVDSAFRRWHGFEHVWNRSRPRRLVLDPNGRAGYDLPMGFEMHWSLTHTFRCFHEITAGPGGNELFIRHERVLERAPSEKLVWERFGSGGVFLNGVDVTDPGRKDPMLRPADGTCIPNPTLLPELFVWQFLMLDPERLGEPSPQTRASNRIFLDRTGANLAEYLDEIRNQDLAAFEGLLDAIRFVIPYLMDLQPALASEIERAFYLKLKEGSFEVPGWLLSTGTLRIVAILSCLRHPNPPALLVIEEVENGLDPRTIHLLVEELRAATEARKTQVILTTHSPYLLDLLDLSQIVVVERAQEGPTFVRPDRAALEKWADKFAPGRLYTMGRLSRRD